ncbi:tRNA pseudouridine synthase-like 1 isoform X2 [Babylonia areolata]|uniref:tRNA pseudouridine synthase-like 1 isoform X2 n=1 Tax=Babylonia areolata TaxID=304850 RepID=UPI003FD6BACA
MGRFLIYFSYIGTHYRGLQIQRHAGEVITRFKTVQGVLEEHLQKLKMVNEMTVKTSSRTDSNVHGLCNTCHVDLVHSHHPVEFNPQWITSKLNRSLSKSNEKLRILNTVRVADDFSSRRKATERSYVYRIAVVKKPDIFTDPAVSGLPWTAQDSDVCSLVYAPFDMDLFLRAAEVLSGSHNFLSFSTRQFYRTGRQLAPNAHISIHVERGRGWMEEERPEVGDLMDHWDVRFHGMSFLYKQIRRMMGAMVMVGKGKMSAEELQRHLDNPSVNNPGQIKALPGVGLTLLRVRYPEHELDFSPEAQGKTAKAEEALGEEESPAKSPLQETVPPPPPPYPTSPSLPQDDSLVSS